MSGEIRQIDSCPVCGAGIRYKAQICSTCNADLSIFIKLSTLPDTLTQIAEDADNNGKGLRAISYLQLARELTPKNLDLLRTQARQAEKLGFPALALELWQEVVEQRPEDEDAIQRIALIEKTLLQKETHPKTFWHKSLLLLPCLFIVLLVGWFGKGWLFTSAPSSSTLTAQEKKEILNKDCSDVLASTTALKHKSFQNIKIQVNNGGIFVSGSVTYPWQLTQLSEILQQIQSCCFKDLTNIRVAKPNSIIYRVKSGDTLSRLAFLFYGNQRDWQRIFKENRQVLNNNPNRLTPGMELIISSWRR